jgi:hypothetical protein
MDICLGLCAISWAKNNRSRLLMQWAMASLLFADHAEPVTSFRMKGEASMSSKLDGPERADLLCFLVMAQLIGHATAGEWLRIDHAVEAGRIWAASNSAECNWLERAKLARIAADIAPTFLVFPCFQDAREIVKLFVDGWMLDYRSPTVRGMLDVCAEHLHQR